MVVGWPIDQYKAAVAKQHVDNIYYFRCTIITKCTLHLRYSQYLVLITYNLLVYHLYNHPHRRISPHYPSTAAIAIVLDYNIKFVQNIQYFYSTINTNTYT